MNEQKPQNQPGQNPLPDSQRDKEQSDHQRKGGQASESDEASRQNRDKNPDRQSDESSPGRSSADQPSRSSQQGNRPSERMDREDDSSLD